MQYRKKPVVIEAVPVKEVIFQIEHNTMKEDWVEEGCASGTIIYELPGLVSVKTLEGTMAANREDWLIQGVKGEIYPCKPDIFEETYEAV